MNRNRYYARVGNREVQHKIHSLITAIYESPPFLMKHVPVLPPQERTDFTLRNL